MLFKPTSDAKFSPCRTWRYTLYRQWGDGPTVAFIGLNPSTADETKDDPTMRRCIGFAKAWGFSRFVMLNLFAFRSTDPNGIYPPREVASAVGPENDMHILEEAEKAELVVAAWGNHGKLHKRGEDIARMVRWARRGRSFQLHAIRVTRAGQPEHPLYLPSSLTPQPWGPAS
jgi:hypothetical protein